MKIKARKTVPLEMEAKIDFPVGKKLEIKSGKMHFDLKENNKSLTIKMDKPYQIFRVNPDELLINDKVIDPEVKKKISKDRKRYLKDFINWSTVSRLLVDNVSTITKAHIPTKHEKNIDELIELIDQWVSKQL